MGSQPTHTQPARGLLRVFVFPVVVVVTAASDIMGHFSSQS